MGLLDSVFVDNELFIFTVTMDDCDICKAVLFSDCYKNALCYKYFFNISSSSKNETIAHLLCARGFPTTYVINKSYELLGILEGVKNLGKKLDSVLYLGQKINDCCIEGVDRDSVFPMLSYSLRAFVCFEKREYDRAQQLAELSLKSGSYVFNNYLFSLICQKNKLWDSTYR